MDNNVIQGRIPNRRNTDTQLEQDQQEALLQLQRDILEYVAINNNHSENLDKLCLAAEVILKQSIASIMLYEKEHNKLVVHSAPSMDKQAIVQLNGLQPGENSGSCGTAMYTKSPVFVANTTIDPRWSNFKQFILDFSVNSCWSMPIHSPGKEIIGTFALSSIEKRTPSEFQKQLLSICANLAGIILNREKMEKHLWDMAHYDALTLLPNRTMLNRRLNAALESAKHNKSKFAVLFLDLDNFKNINDSYGHTIGDEALINVANAMVASTREQDTLARAGGDEFVLLIENITDESDTCQVAEKIINELHKLPPIAGTNTSLTTSIGISIYPDHATTISDMLRNADTAMYQAKKNGRNGYSFYKASLTTAIQNQLKIVAELKHALVNNELELFYQPQFNSKTNELLSVEALIRWNHPSNTLFSPAEFIPIAEKSNLICEVGSWAIKQACIQGKDWLESGAKFDRISVNLSIRQLTYNFGHQIETILQETQFPADKLELEITETLLMTKGEIAIPELNKLQSLGVSIALDDFGTGYSSLHQIRTLPINKLKIDQSFIKELPDNEQDAILARMIILMGKNLSLQVVAEGVETQEQQQFLINEECDLLQGYFLGKPMTETDLKVLLRI